MSASRLFSCRICDFSVSLPDEEICHCNDVPDPHPHGWGMYPVVLFPSGERKLVLMCPECVEEYHIIYATLEEQSRAQGQSVGRWVPVVMERPVHDPSLN